MKKIISQKCPRCFSHRIRLGYRSSPLPLKLFFLNNLLCEHCNWTFRGFAIPKIKIFKVSKLKSSTVSKLKSFKVPRFKSLTVSKLKSLAVAKLKIGTGGILKASSKLKSSTVAKLRSFKVPRFKSSTVSKLKSLTVSKFKSLIATKNVHGINKQKDPSPKSKDINTQQDKAEKDGNFSEKTENT